MSNNSITVVLTLYKRPYNLEKQLNSLLNQTVKPSEIWLFQDYADNESVSIPNELVNKFDNIKVMKENVGVWGRFDFARNANTEYVCIFDDDTIPGKKWFKNCISEMQKHEGLYGTNGVFLVKPEQYPFGGFFNVGVHNPNSKVQRVDFVGHSWFLKTKWLNYMFDNTECLQKLKTAGEDMTLSAKLLEKGINTFVPAHPLEDVEFWGSIPSECEKNGRDINALSININHLKKFNTGIITLLNMGYKPIIESLNNKKTLKIIYEVLRRLTWIFYRNEKQRISIRYKFYNFVFLDR